MTERIVTVDLEVDAWRIPEARAYRTAVGVNAEYAAAKIQQAFVDAREEGLAKFGEAMDAEGWEPPDDWMPASLFNFEPDYLLGFAWIPARRTEPELGYEAFAESLKYGDLVAAFWDAMVSAAEAAVPFENRADRRSRGPASKTASRSATTSSGASKTSTGSRSKSSPSRSKSSTKPTVRIDGD